MIRIGLRGFLMLYFFLSGNPQNPILIMKAPILGLRGSGILGSGYTQNLEAEALQAINPQP